MSDRTLALAGLFQATELVRQAARHGTWSGYAASASLGSLLALEADDVAGIFGEKAHLRVGIEALIGVLEGEAREAEALRYAVGLLQIERRFRADDALQHRVGTDIERIGRLGADLARHDREDLQAHEIAGLYRDTISGLKPRIVVNGRPAHLQVERTKDWIRTLLFAGLRSAVLWRQLGGGRFGLIFGRKKILAEARACLPL